MLKEKIVLVTGASRGIGQAIALTLGGAGATVIESPVCTPIGSKFSIPQTITPLPKDNPFKRLTLPMMTYPDCEACSCSATPDLVPEGEELLDAWEETAVQNQSVLANLNDSVFYETIDPDSLCYNNDENKQYTLWTSNIWVFSPC